MSLESLCTGDTVTVQLETTITGAAFGPAESYADIDTLDCNVQIKEGSESLNYQARGAMYTHRVYFAANPNLTNRHRLKWVSRENVTQYLRVLAVRTQGPPGETWLWFADCDSETTRREP